MTQKLSETVAYRLHGLLGTASLNEGQKRLATALAARLERPIRITVAGFEKSCKSALLEMILGERLVSGVSAPTIDIVYGDTPRTRLQDAQGGVRYVDLEAGANANEQPITQCTLELPLPQLKSMQLTELTLPDEEVRARTLLDTLDGVTEVVIWCSQSVEEREILLWSRLPDRLKDHSFLVVSMEDQAGERDNHVDVRKMGKAAATAGFPNLFPIAARQALLARSEGQILDPARWKSSGAAAFMTALTSEIETNRTADLDHAEFILAKHERQSERSAVNIKPTKWSDGLPKPLVQVARPTDCAVGREDCIGTALSILNAVFDTETNKDTATQPVAKEILHQTAQASRALSTLFAETSLQFPEMAEISYVAQDCDEMLAQLQNENTEAAARDAITALLQVKKEISEVISA